MDTKEISYKDNTNIEVIDGFIVQQVSNDVWAIDEFGIDLMYLIIGEERALLLDTGLGLGNIRKVVESLTKLPIIVVNSHHHYDHVGGNNRFEQIYAYKEAIPVILEQNTAEYRKSFFESQAKRREYSGCDTFEEDIIRVGKFELIAIEEGYVFDLGNRKLEVLFTPGHTKDCICLLDRENRLLFSADTLVSTPTLLFDHYSADLGIYQQSLKKLWDYRGEYELIFPGHFLRPIGTIYLENMMTCVEHIMENNQIGVRRDISDTGCLGYYYKYKRASVIYGPNKI